MKRVVAGLAAIAMVFGLAGVASTGFVSFDNTIVANATPASGFSHTSNSMQNEYLKLAFSGSHFYLDTTGGNPETTTDDYQRLLYHSTSYTTIRIGETNYIFNNENVTFDEANQAVIAVNEGEDIEVTQKFSFVRNENTGRRDVVEMSYTVRNIGTSGKDVGLRIMLDTMIGNNDRAPFRIPGIGDVTTERTFTGNGIPATFQAVDSLSNPSVIASGSFLRGPIRPDQVQFARYSGASSNSWGYQTEVGRDIGDSAVTATWNQRLLAPDESRTYTIHYGMSELTQNANTDISITSMVPTIATYNEADDSFANFDVTGILSNISGEDLENAWMRIELPGGMSLVDPNAQPDDSSEVDSSDVDSSEADSSDVDSSEVDSSEVDSSEADSSATDSESTADSETPADSSVADSETPADSNVADSETPADSSVAADETSSESTDTSTPDETTDTDSSSVSGSLEDETSTPAVPTNTNVRAAGDTETTDEPTDEEVSAEVELDTITTALLETDGELSYGWTVSIDDSITREQYYPITIVGGADGVEELAVTRYIYVGLEEPAPTPTPTPDSSSTTPSSSVATTSSTTSTPAAASTPKETNPATGTAAVLGSMALLAAAAVVVSRKK